MRPPVLAIIGAYTPVVFTISQRFEGGIADAKGIHFDKGGGETGRDTDFNLIFLGANDWVPFQFRNADRRVIEAGCGDARRWGT